MINLKVLIIEDAEADAILLVEELRRGGYEPHYMRVETPEAVYFALDQQTWQVVISDYALPKISARDALAMLQQRGLEVPFILVSGIIGEEAAAAMMKAGAHDYILKGHFSRLVPAIARELKEAATRRERRRMEEGFRQSTDRLKLALAAARMDIWEWDIVANRIHWSRETAATFGLQPGAFPGTYEAFLELVWPDDRQAVARSLENAVENTEAGSYFDLEIRILRPDGQVRWLQTKSQVFRNSQGLPLRVLGIGMDITARKNSEQQLRASEERFEELFRNNPALMFISTVDDGVIVDANKAFTSSLGYAREELLGQTELEINLWEEPEFRTDIVRQLYEPSGSLIHNLKAHLLHKSGALLPGLCSFVTIDLEGKPSVLATIIDLS
jgi:PAS domain S-box-containing protein